MKPGTITHLVTSRSRCVPAIAWRGASVAAVHDVTLAIRDDEILGIAGESGLRQIHADQADLWRSSAIRCICSPGPRRRSSTTTPFRAPIFIEYWWDFISYIPQGSMSVLNPVMRIEDQMLDAIPAPPSRARPRRAAR